MFAEVALSDTGSKTFTYRIPDHLKDRIFPGSAVVVPLRKSLATGVIVDIVQTTRLAKTSIKDVNGCLDPGYSIDERRLTWLKWLADYYICPLGDVLRVALPPGLIGRPRLRITAGQMTPSDSRHKYVYDRIRAKSGGYRFIKGKPILDGVSNTLIGKLIKEGHLFYSADIKKISPAKRVLIRLNSKAVGANLSPEENRMVEFLIEHPEGFPQTSLLKLGFALKIIKRLAKAEVIGIETGREEAVIPTKSRNPQPLELNIGQKQAFDKIENAIAKKLCQTFLLFGVTGSGKTAVYIEAARKALQLGHSVLILLPEISLTPQAVDRYTQHLGVSVGLWHSKITPAQRADLYMKAKSGQIRLVVGVRSAVFVPLNNLGLIVVDEEQDDSYKQSDPQPRYNARDVALVRAKAEGTITILGTATPSLESYHNALAGKYYLLKLTERYAGSAFPAPTIIDLKQTEVQPQYWPLSEEFIESICTAVADDKQVILLLNRRGYASVLVCKTCGWIALCRDCRVALTYHRPQANLICHFCGLAESAPETCPACKGTQFDYRGIGTQKLEEILIEILGQKGIIRMDSDSTSRKGTLEKMIAAFELGDSPVLLGTKMVAKGHHFPKVGLVGVVLADAGLYLPDFRATEKTFQLLVQAAGRAGRSAEIADGGRFVVQTYSAAQPLLESASRQDFEAFYAQEIEHRRELGYPPFGKIIRLVISGEDDSFARWASRQIAKEVRANFKGGVVLGPAATGVFRMGRKYHYQALLKGRFSAVFKNWLKGMVERWHQQHGKEVLIKVDVDPREMI